MSYSGNYKDVGKEEYRFIWVSKGIEDERWEERWSWGLNAFAKEIVLKPEGYWRILSRKSMRSKSALKCSHFHQYCTQGTHSSGPPAAVHLCLINSNHHTLNESQTYKNVRIISKTKTNNKASSKILSTKTRKVGCRKMKARDAWGKIMFSGLRSHNMKI